MPAFIRHSSPLSGTTKAQGSQGDGADGEGEWLHLREPRALGDFSWPFEVGSLELEGFLAEVESGHFGVEVLELHPELRWGPPLLPEYLVLGDSMDGLGVTALGGDCLVAQGSTPGMWGGVSPTA